MRRWLPSSRSVLFGGVRECPRLVDPVAHRSRMRAGDREVGRARIERVQAVASASTAGAAAVRTSQLARMRSGAVRLLARECRVPAPARGVLHLVVLATGVVDAVGEREPDLGEPGMVPACLEQRQRREREPLLLVAGTSGVSPDARVCRQRAGERDAGGVAVTLGTFGGLVAKRRRGGRPGR